MAIKDWKKRGTSFNPRATNSWINKEGNVLNIFHVITAREYKKFGTDWYVVSIPSQDIEKDFQTKSQAIAYGKAYMRKN
jgi:hypothetical protein